MNPPIKISPSISSKGGALAIRVGLGYQKAKLGKIVCISGWPAKWDTFQLAPVQQTTPVLLIHGLSDPVVLPQHGAALFERLEAQKLNVKRLTHPGGHGLGNLMDEVKEFVLQKN